jgi:hypothetical protein
MQINILNFHNNLKDNEASRHHNKGKVKEVEGSKPNKGKGKEVEASKPNKGKGKEVEASKPNKGKGKEVEAPKPIKGKEKENVTSEYIKEKEKRVEVIISDNEGPFHLFADASIIASTSQDASIIASTSQVKHQAKKNVSGVNLLYIFIKRLRLFYKKSNYFLDDQPKNKRKKIDVDVQDRKSGRIAKQSRKGSLAILFYHLQ